MSGWLIVLGILLGMALLIVVGLFACSYLLFRMVFDRRGRICLEAENEETAADSDRALGQQWLQERRAQLVQIQSQDGLTLSAWYIPATTRPDEVAIVVHGYTDNGLGVTPHARLLQEQTGCALLLPNLRAHGQSEGRYVGFGWPDRLDLLRWVDRAIALQGAHCQVALFGISMGASTVLMASGERLPPQVRCIISDCGYSSAEEELSCQLHSLLHLPVFPFMPLVNVICRIVAGYAPSQASAVKQVRKSTLPILFIHGAADTFVPTAMVHQLYAAAPGRKELLVVPHAAHCEAYQKDPEGYARAVLALWREAMVPQAAEQPQAGRVLPFGKVEQPSVS